MTVALALMTALGPLSTDMYLPALPALAQDLGGSIAQAQLTLSVFLIGFAVGQFVHGPLSDRLGRRPVLVASLAIFILASLVCAAAPSIETLIAARFVQAIGASGPIVLARAMVRDLYEGPRAGRELSRIGGIMGLVPALAPILGGLMLEVWNWRAIFALKTACGVAIAVTAALMLPESLKARAAAPLSFAAILRGFATLLRHAGYRAYVALIALAYGGLFAFISGSSFVLQGLYGLSELAYALAFALMCIGYIGGTVLAQAALGRFGLDGTIGLGVTAMALGGVLMLALVAAEVPSSLAISLPMAVFAAGIGLASPQALAAAMLPFPDRAGAASSLIGICQMTFGALVGTGLAPLLGASPLPMPAVIAAAGVLALVVFATTRRVRQRR